MLRNISESNFGFSNKHADSILRHKVRNLRAKVKTLLPINVCQKYNKRNKTIKENSQKRSSIELERCYTRQQRWRVPKQTCQHWYYQTTGSEERAHMFSKLTSEEIEQINQDRLYYLGANHIEAFQDFMSEKSYNRTFAKTSEGTRKYVTQQCKQNKFSIESFRKRREKKTNSQIKQTQRLTDLINSVNDWLEEVNEKDTTLKQNRYEAFEQKRRQIIQENQTRTNQSKVVSQQKHSKAENNLEQIKITIQEKIKQRSKVYEIKRKNVLKVRHEKLQKGEIVDLTERLRRICLSKSKSNTTLMCNS